MTVPPLHRREFLKASAALASAFWVSGSSLAKASTSPNEKLNIAVIGPGGRGYENLKGVSSQNIVALVDADERRAGEAFEQFPKAKKFADFRRLFDEANTFDAVVVSTPDHTHASPTATAIKLGKHAYCEKPLTHTVHEARYLAELAEKHKVATQMGTQIHATDNYRRVVELVQAGAVGDVKEVHVWVGKGWGGGELPTDKPPVPEGLHWDVWLGPAPERPYSPIYVPANWRRWWAFGNGTLGDMGCHYMDLAFWALKLRHPSAVTAEGPPVHAETAPLGMKVHYEFPKTEHHSALTMHWYDGDMTPKEVAGHKVPGAGVMFVGDKGELFADYGGRKLYPEDKYADYKAPEPTIPNSIGHYEEWFKGIRTGEATTCNFNYSGALTETVLLGTVAYRTGLKLDWDPVNLTCRNQPAANALLRREYRDGWTL